MEIEIRNNPVANNIMHIMKAKGLKQCAIAARAGYSSQALNDMLKGRRLIKVNDVVVLANALDVSPGCLFYQNGQDGM